jgi:hypothetical protein
MVGGPAARESGRDPDSRPPTDRAGDAHQARGSVAHSPEKSVLMIVNLLLALLFVLMILRDGGLWVRHRRRYRLVFVLFWSLLLYVHVHRLPDRYLLIVLVAFVAAICLKVREYANISWALKKGGGENLLAPKSGVSPTGPGLWDREFDGHG